jgi:hypothetical protein
MSSCLVTRRARPDKPARIRERLGETNESKIGVEIVVMKKLARRYQRDNYFLRRFTRLAFASSEDAIIVTRVTTISACAQAELSATDQLPHAL